MANAVTLSVAVWEYVHFSGTWTAYPPDVCEKLERARIKSESKDETKVPIDISCSGVKAHFVDVVKMQQVFGDEPDHCAASPVRRNLYPLDSAPAKGVNWEWRTNSGEWYPYSVHLSCLIEKAKEQGLPKINLQDNYPECIYTVEFTTMHQRNNLTSLCHVIRRVEGENYPLAPDYITCPRLNLNLPERKPNPTELMFPESDSDSSDVTVIAEIRKPNPTELMSPESDSDSSDVTVIAEIRKPNPTELMSPASESDSSDVTVIAQIFTKRRKGRRSIHTASFVGIPSTIEGASDTKSLKTEGSNSLHDIKLPNNSWPDSVQDPPEPEDFLARHMVDVTGTIPAEDCSICCEPLVASSSYNSSGRVVSLFHCSHHFHYACLAAMYKSNGKASYLQCPVCKAIYGVKQGNQPSGIMNFQVLPFTLPGYEGCDTIQITYHIPSGVQGPEHPRPGMPYTARGFPRHGYLPNNDQGRQALKLLVEAWERRLIFTIGQSTTTGEQDTVTWNVIHLKTECGSNDTGHGFPDPSYLDNLLAELRAHGVTG